MNGRRLLQCSNLLLHSCGGGGCVSIGVRFVVRSVGVSHTEGTYYNLRTYCHTAAAAGESIALRFVVRPGLAAHTVGAYYDLRTHCHTAAAAARDGRQGEEESN